jgi:hypothetical protein
MIEAAYLFYDFLILAQHAWNFQQRLDTCWLFTWPRCLLLPMFLHHCKRNFYTACVILMKSSTPAAFAALDAEVREIARLCQTLQHNCTGRCVPDVQDGPCCCGNMLYTLE